MIFTMIPLILPVPPKTSIWDISKFLLQPAMLPRTYPSLGAPGEDLSGYAIRKWNHWVKWLYSFNFSRLEQITVKGGCANFYFHVWESSGPQFTANKLLALSDFFDLCQSEGYKMVSFLF